MTRCPLPAALLALACAATVPSAKAAEDAEIFTFLQADQLEYRIADGTDTLSWDVQGWIGGDYDRVWLKTQGDAPLDGSAENAQIELKYGRLVAPFWELQVGGRYDPRPEPSRGFGVVALQGLAPYFFEVNAEGFVSDEGDVSARLETEYQILLTQRLILQPSAELNFAVQDVEEVGVGSGLSQVELGLRLRYEVVREVAPYVGFVWERRVGQTAQFARREGEDVEVPAFVVGVRLWF